MKIEQLPEKTYERNLNHNYMILKEEDLNTDYGYQVKMLTDNHIQGLLPVSLRVDNGIEYFYYDIQSRQTMDRIYERKSITYHELIVIIKSFLQLEKRLQNYLLSYDGIIMDPSFLYMDMEAREIQFVYYPGYQQDPRCGFIELVEYMLTKTDHSDERAVVLIYKLYRYTRNENFVLSEIEGFIEEKTEAGMQVSKELGEQEIPKSTSLTGMGVAATWSEEFSQNQESEKYTGETALERQTPTYTSDQKKINSEHKKDQRGLPARIIMYVCITISVILLGVLSVEKWLELIYLPPKIEMFVFAGIIVFAVLGLIFNIVAASMERTEKKMDIEEDKKEESKNTVKEINRIKENPNPIQYRQISPPVQTMQNQGMYPQQFFENAGETMVIGDMENGHILRGCDGEQFEYKIDHFPILIGRIKSYVDLAFDDVSVSKMHARLEEKNGRIYLQDMNSTNGTKRNGEWIGMHESVPIMPGDELIFGKVKVRYCTS